MPVLMLIFIAIPLLEIYLLIKIGGLIGAMPTIALVVLTAVVGVALLRAQGIATLHRLQQQLSDGVLPAMEIIEGVILLVSGALLLTPGVATDLVGFACLIPAVRRVLAQRFLRKGNFVARGYTANGRDSQVIEGEYRREDQ